MLPTRKLRSLKVELPVVGFSASKAVTSTQRLVVSSPDGDYLMLMQPSLLEGCRQGSVDLGWGQIPFVARMI